MTLNSSQKRTPASQLADFDYALPEDRIARHPCAERDQARLLSVRNDTFSDYRVSDLPELLKAGDLLVANDTRVVPARCRMRRLTGAEIEVLFLRRPDGYTEAMVRKSRKLNEGETLYGPEGYTVSLVERLGEGRWRIDSKPSAMAVMSAIGQMPLPPYMKRDALPSDRERYQTTYAKSEGAIAAPTAGLHITDGLRARIRERQIGWATVTLHVGAGTFRPLRPSDIEAGELHSEWYDVPQSTRQAIQDTRQRGGRVIAIGTTTTRALESATPPDADLPTPGPGVTRLFIQEAYSFRCVDGLLTNFHLPQSSLLFLVSAFTGRERLFNAYQHALQHDYRFYSYGDAMLIL